MRQIPRPVFVLVLLIVAAAWGQNRANQRGPTARSPLKAADLQIDAQILRRAYESLHPGLYQYNTPSEMDAKFEALRLQLNHDQSLAEAYLAFSSFAAKVKCGHTYPNFFNQAKMVAEELFHGQNRVPFYFEWVDRRMVVTQDFTPNHLLSRGTEVRAINGIAAATILRRLMTVARADGSNDAKRIALLGLSGESVYEAFDLYFPLFFPRATTRMKLLLRGPGASRPRTVEVQALTYAERIAPILLREEGRKGGKEAVFAWKYLDDGSAYLRMATWALYDSKWDWKGWMNARLDEFVDRKAPALILDLRGNEGGNDLGNIVLARLVTKELKLAKARRLVRYRRVPEDLIPYLDTWDPSFKDWGASAVDLEQPWPTAPPVKYYKLTKFDDDAEGDVIKPDGKHYAGRVFVLVDSNNSSATFQFARVIQENKLGLLVGQPTGGNQRGINGGAFFFLRLPRSQIEMDLPLIGYFPLTDKPDVGLTPDILVKTRIEDIVEGTDAGLATIARIIRQSLN